MSLLPPETRVIDALQTVADGVVDLVGFDLSAVSLAVDGEVLETLVVAGSDETGQELLGGRVSVADVERQLARGQSWDGWHLLTHGPSRQLVSPIRDTAHRLRGLLHVDVPRDCQPPDPAEVEMLRYFTEQARHAVLGSLERGRLIERVRLADAARLIVRRASSELSIDRIIELCQPAMTSGFDAVGMWMQIFDEEGRGTDVVYGATEGDIEIPEDLKTLGRVAAVQLWQSQEVAVATDRIAPAIDGVGPGEEQRVHEFMGITLEATSMLFVPLGAGRECLGNLALTRRGDAVDWSETEKQVALDIGHDLGRALLNARTFERERRLAAELRELDGYKSRLITTLAHELKNPLTSIAGHTEMLSSWPDLPATAQRAISSVERGAARMQNTITDLLVLAEVGDSERPLAASAVDLRAMVDDVLDLLRIEIRDKGLTVSVESSGDPVLAHGERFGLDLVCSNLVSNAVKYTQRGGVVTITLGRAGGQVQLSVSDTGLGIAEEDQKKLFEEFFRSSNPVAVAESGTGLGLSIVQRVVDRHDGGSIAVSSALGIGTTFTLTLPASTDADLPADAS